MWAAGRRAPGSALSPPATRTSSSFLTSESVDNHTCVRRPHAWTSAAEIFITRHPITQPAPMFPTPRPPKTISASCQQTTHVYGLLNCLLLTGSLMPAMKRVPGAAPRNQRCHVPSLVERCSRPFAFLLRCHGNLLQGHRLEENQVRGRRPPALRRRHPTPRCPAQPAHKDPMGCE